MENKKQAFTLAEVLLVLAIIGVIAAVTIPAIMQQSSEKKFSALAKKAQSTLQNAIDLKVATVPISPGEMGVGTLQWLLDGEEDGTSTLKAAKRNNTTNTTIMQTPDGMIWHLINGQDCGGQAGTKANPLNCDTRFIIDLNGAEGPTKSTFENAATLLTASNLQHDKKAYDTIYLQAYQDMKIRTCLNYTGYQVCGRTVKYLGVPPS